MQYTLLILNNLNLLFLILIFSRSILAISSTNWLRTWIALELNIISFIPLITESKNTSTNESALKYFLIQVVGSSLFIMISISNNFSLTIFSIYSRSVIFLRIPLLIKLGAAPFQTWFIIIMNKINWWKALLLATWQKIAPLFILSYLNLRTKIIVFISLLSLMTGRIGGLSQITFQKIFAYSSLTHLGWLICSITNSKQLIFFYFSFYTIINTILFTILFAINAFHINQNVSYSNNFAFLTATLSLRGLPPFWGFIPKWIIIQHLIIQNQEFLAFILIISALINLFFYLRLITNYSLLSYSSFKWFFQNSQQLKLKITTFIFSINLVGLLTFNFLLF